VVLILRGFGRNRIKGLGIRELVVLVLRGLGVQ